MIWLLQVISLSFLFVLAFLKNKNATSKFKSWGNRIREKKAIHSLKRPSVQFSSVAQSCPTLCDPMNRSTPGLPVHRQLLEFTETHVHWVSDAIQPSHPLSSPSPPAPNPSQHQSLFQWVNSSALMSPNICCMSDGMNETANPLLPFCTVLSVCCVNSRTLPWQCGVSITGAPENSLALHFYNLHCPLASETVPHGSS